MTKVFDIRGGLQDYPKGREGAFHGYEFCRLGSLSRVAIPHLTVHGVLPPGAHDCELTDIKTTYAHNDHRAMLWDRCVAFLQDAKAVADPGIVLIDGSFTSDKSLLGDVDVVFDLTSADDTVRKYWLYEWATKQSQIKIDYQVDFWVFVPGIQNDLREFFRYVRVEEALRRGMSPGDRKGLLRVAL